MPKQPFAQVRMGRPQKEGDELVSRRDVMAARKAAAHESGVDPLQKFRALCDGGRGSYMKEHSVKAASLQFPPPSGGGRRGAEAPWRGRQEGVAGVSGVVAQAMRSAGCPNRRSLGYKRSVPPRGSMARLAFKWVKRQAGQQPGRRHWRRISSRPLFFTLARGMD